MADKAEVGERSSCKKRAIFQGMPMKNGSNNRVRYYKKTGYDVEKEVSSEVFDFSRVGRIFHHFSAIFHPYFSAKRLIFRWLEKKPPINDTSNIVDFRFLIAGWGKEGLTTKRPRHETGMEEARKLKISDGRFRITGKFGTEWNRRWHIPLAFVAGAI